MPLSPRLRWKLDRFRDQLSATFGGRKQDARPRLCPACGTLVGSTATRCHVCGTSLTFSLAAASRSLQGLLPTTSPATYIIVGLSCILYVFSYMITIHLGGGGPPSGGGFSALFNLGAIDGRVLQALGASGPLPYNIAQPWRFVMAVFLHASLLHIGFNMWVLLDFGPIVEERFGSARYFFLYVATGILGFLVSSLMGNVSVGGSGAILGICGVALAITSGARSASDQMLRSNVIRLLIFIAVLFFLPFGGFGGRTDNSAHLGGLAAGFLLGKIMADRPPLAPAERNRSNLLGLVVGLAVVASLVMAVRSYFAAVG